MLYGIDIFSGAGGLSIGAEMAGVQIMFAVEKDKYAAETYRFNHKDIPVICEDIHNIDPLQYIKPIEEQDQLIVFGGPPCQGFSTSNTVTRNMQNPNNSLFEEFVRFVATLNPYLGYTVTDALLTASDYGVPQHRNRFIMVGNRHDIEFMFPEKLRYPFYTAP